jgi:hypothetical protein
MNFLGIRHNLARILLSKISLALAIFFLSGLSLFADESQEPIVLPLPELIAPVQLVDGVVSEVIVPEAPFQFANHTFSSKSDHFFSQTHGAKNSPLLFTLPSIPGALAICSPRENATMRGLVGQFALQDSLKNKADAEPWDLKSVANLGLVAFFEICLSQSELLSRNLSTQCVNSLLKSTIQKSANALRFSWQQAKMTYHWPKSTSSSQILKTSILDPLQSPSHSMSDTSSTWSKEMVVFPQILQGTSLVILMSPLLTPTYPILLRRA